VQKSGRLVDAGAQGERLDRPRAGSQYHGTPYRA
jgi:hypothetical protein